MTNIQNAKVQEGKTNAASGKEFDTRQAVQFGYDAKKINLLQRSARDNGERRKNTWRNVHDALLQEQVTCTCRPENIDDSNMPPRKF